MRLPGHAHGAIGRELAFESGLGTRDPEEPRADLRALTCLASPESRVPSPDAKVAPATVALAKILCYQ